MAAELMIDGGAEVTEPYGFGQPFQPCPGQFNPGIDLAAACGTIIRAVGYGQVLSVGVPCWAGRHAVIVRSDSVDLLWAHCSQHFVESGQMVGPHDALCAIGSETGCPACGAAEGDPCGASQNCGGIATGPHTHFQANIAGEPFDSMYCRGLDPNPYLTSWPGLPPASLPAPPGPPVVIRSSRAVLLLAAVGVGALIVGSRSS